MAGPGHITTARGDSLNIDDLIAKANRPIGLKEEKSTIKKKSDPSKRKQLNVRGFQPAQGESKPPEANTQEQPEQKKVPVSAYNDGNDARSVSDMTGIKVEKKATTKKPDKPAAEAASDALGDILGTLEETAPNSVAAAEEVEKEETKKPVTRKRTRSTTK